MITPGVKGLIPQVTPGAKVLTPGYGVEEGPCSPTRGCGPRLIGGERFVGQRPTYKGEGKG